MNWEILDEMKQKAESGNMTKDEASNGLSMITFALRFLIRLKEEKEESIKGIDILILANNKARNIQMEITILIRDIYKTMEYITPLAKIGAAIPGNENYVKILHEATKDIRIL
jgi:hypothetical protein